MIGPKFKSVCQIVDFEIDWFDEKWRSIQFYPMTFLHDKELRGTSKKTYSQRPKSPQKHGYIPEFREVLYWLEGSHYDNPLHYYSVSD